MRPSAWRYGSLLLGAVTAMSWAQARQETPALALEAPRFEVPAVSQPQGAPDALRIERALDVAGTARANSADRSAPPPALGQATPALVPKPAPATAAAAPAARAEAGVVALNQKSDTPTAPAGGEAAQRAGIDEPSRIDAKGASPRVVAARLWPANEYTRVAIETTRAVQHTFFSLRNPDRLVLDLHSLEHSVALSELPAKLAAHDPQIRAIRVARNRPGVMRIVFELKMSVDANVFPVRPVGGYSHRIVIDIVPTQPTDPVMALLQQSAPAAPAAGAGSPVGNTTAAKPAGTAAVAQAPAAAVPGSTPAPASARGGAAQLPSSAPMAAGASGSAPSVAAPVSVSAAAANKTETAKPTAAAPAAAKSASEQASAAVQREAAREPAAKAEVARLAVVAVDAGHGGEDPGALGRNGTREKHVTLAIARRIKAELENDPNIRVVLTRDGDYFVPLAQRVAKARRAQADVFVSIHADAFVRPDARGSSVFALSSRGASSAAARWLAQRENQADLVGGVNLSKRDPNLARTLLDLSQTVTINDSLQLGRSVLREIGGLNRLHKSRVEQAGFAVLKAPDIASILVETAFISNPDEERRLADADYQVRMARVIVDGIKKYLAANPPPPRENVTQAKAGARLALRD